MSNRELLLMEAIRRLDSVYSELWGFVTGQDDWLSETDCDTFRDGYDAFTAIMGRIIDPLVPLTPVTTGCTICSDPKCAEPGGKH